MQAGTWTWFLALLLTFYVMVSEQLSCLRFSAPAVKLASTACFRDAVAVISVKCFKIRMGNKLQKKEVF